MNFRFFIVGIISFWLQTTMGQQVFEWTPRAIQGYQYATSLQLNNALKVVDEMKKQEPNNMLVYFIEDYIDFFNLFIGEERTTYQLLKNKKDIRLKMIRKGNENSPYYKFCQADIYLHWALVKLKFNEKTSAALDIRKAYSLLNQNENDFPNFMPNKKSLGVMHALIGTIPSNYKWLSNIIGITGTIDQGIQEIQLALNQAQNKEKIFELETVVMFAFMMLYLQNSPESAWSIVSTSSLNHKTNPLANFALANIASRTGRNEEAIRILKQRPKSQEFLPFYYLDLLEGMVKLKKLDLSAEKNIQVFLQNFKGENYIKEAFQKLGWIGILKNNNQSYFRCMQKCIQKGANETDEDKSAFFEAQKAKVPHIELLKARLLSDGGYAIQAHRTLINASNIIFEDKEYLLEFNYRLGRSYQMLKNYHDAIETYEKVIEMGENNPAYFACRSALSIGNIYEDQKKYDKAVSYYEKCLEMEPSEYANGLHQKAEAGINRIRKK
ncbi:MAG: tetratricopeptide repeat protein [Saprospiraceae bacterium]|nr:tetratricopeptide repeat protein [Saprospiraceae bacterium]